MCVCGGGGGGGGGGGRLQWHDKEFTCLQSRFSFNHLYASYMNTSIVNTC